MNRKCNVIVDAWLGQILVTGCEVGTFIFTQTMPAIKLYPVQVFVSNKISTQRITVLLIFPKLLPLELFVAWKPY